jgi:hypothetical protein
MHFLELVAITFMSGLGVWVCELSKRLWNFPAMRTFHQLLTPKGVDISGCVGEGL